MKKLIASLFISSSCFAAPQITRLNGVGAINGSYGQEAMVVDQLKVTNNGIVTSTGKVQLIGNFGCKPKDQQAPCDTFANVSTATNFVFISKLDNANTLVVLESVKDFDIVLGEGTRVSSKLKFAIIANTNPSMSVVAIEALATGRGYVVAKDGDYEALIGGSKDAGRPLAPGTVLRFSN